jgi:hypothetical protein
VRVDVLEYPFDSTVFHTVVHARRVRSVFQRLILHIGRYQNLTALAVAGRLNAMIR